MGEPPSITHGLNTRECGAKQSVSGVRKHDDFKKNYGLGDAIANVVRHAPFSTFEPTKEFKLDKVVVFEQIELIGEIKHAHACIHEP